MLAYERIGSGPTLVLVHGIGHRRQAWYPVVDLLAEHREIVLVDLPGHGASDPLVTEGRPILDVLHEYFAAFIQQLGLESAHVAGNSLGGRIALEAGVMGLASSVTALSPAGFWRTDAGFSYTRGLFGAVTAISGAVAPLAPWLSRSSAGRALMFNWIMAKPTRMDPESALADFRAFGSAREAMQEIMSQASAFSGDIPSDIPVTVAWADRDLVLPPYQADVARAVLPKARHVVLHGCGHVPMFDDPDQVAAVLLAGSDAPERRPFAATTDCP